MYKAGDFCTSVCAPEAAKPARTVTVVPRVYWLEEAGTGSRVSTGGSIQGREPRETGSTAVFMSAVPYAQ